VFIQLSLWIIGGVTFSLLPVDSIIKGGAIIEHPATPMLSPDWMDILAGSPIPPGEIHSIRAHHSSQGLLLEVQSSGNSVNWIHMDDSTTVTAPSISGIGQFAASLYKGDGEQLTARHLEAAETNIFGLINDLQGARDVWLVPFDDTLGTRLYFDGSTGRYLAVRNNYWAFYNAMWRLHIMDYSGGEDSNNWTLRLFALLAALFATSGVILTVSAMKRGWERYWRGRSAI